MALLTGKVFFGEIEIEVLPDVYGPREDSMLLAKCVSVKPGSKVLDIGCGTGIVSIVAALQGAEVTAVDTNEKALENVKLNAFKHGVKIRTVKSDLFQNINERFDFIFFNPPYVPHEEIDEKMLEEFGSVVKSWDGGKGGREHIDRFIDSFGGYLRDGGKAYLLNSSKNKIEKTKRKLKKNRYSWKVCQKEKLFFETLYVFEISKGE